MDFAFFDGDCTFLMSQSRQEIVCEGISQKHALIFYMPEKRCIQAIEKTMSPSDTACASRPGERPATYKVGKVWLHPGSQWVETFDTQIELLGWLSELSEYCRKYLGYLELPASPASILRPKLEELGWGQEPGGRHAARDALHQGPSGIFKASSDANLYDRKQAFLAPFNDDFPSGLIKKQASKDELLRCLFRRGAKGLAVCRLEQKAEFIPGLPAHTNCGTLYGRGLVCGSYTFDMLRIELEAGRIEILDCTELYVWYRPYRKYEDFYSFICSIPEKILRKALYTRAWGLLAGGSGYTGKIPAYRETKGKKFPGSSLLWKKQKDIEESQKAPRMYRPIDAATICTSNHVAMQRSVISNEKSISMMHIDSIAITGKAKLNFDSFDLKYSGKIRCFGTGTYKIFDENGLVIRNKAMGFSPKDEWGEARIEQERHLFQVSLQDRRRLWDYNPAKFDFATSEPITIDSGHYVFCDF